ncbi:MAG: TRAP transporter large permease [Deltaproteobacteria bacterium]|jgi:tripartite ATP-independent transporter DctM subunit|nr:TRAP transporter large permease [Deltaproteobacteria bacterium]
MLTLVFFIGLLIILFVLGIPVCVSIGLTCLAVLWFENGLTNIPLSLLPLKMMHGVNNFPLLAVPFFILAANVMNKGSVTPRIFNFANSLVGHLRGGLGHVNVLASMIFAGMSGTAVADAAGLGALEIRAMRDQGYSLEYSTGITGASSVIGPIIPPSVAMVIYGWLSDVSVGALFIGGLIPGVMLGLALMIMTVVLSYRVSMPMQTRPPLAETLRLSRRAALSLMTPVIIVGGIWSGIFTPTESGAVASAYAIVLGTVVYRELGLKELLDVFKNTIEFTAIILFIISIAGLYGWLLVRLQIPMILADGVVKLTTNPTLLLLILMVFFLIIGCFMSVIESVLIFTPIMVPMVKMMDIDPLFFGVVMVISLSVGVITPPFGNVIYVLVGITDQSFEAVVKALFPFMVPILVTILVLILFPELVTYLPYKWISM